MTIYERFNLDRPEDFTGHSLSVGDVVVLNREGNRQASFVDIIGFKDLPDFWPAMSRGKAAVEAVTERADKQIKEQRLRTMPERKEAAVRL